jgi:hypothetical protein
MATQHSGSLPSDPSMELLCHVYDYTLAHKTLVIELTRGDYVKGEKSYVHFTGVEFFCGPMAWKGGGFEVAPAAECLNLLKALGAREPTVRGYHLYEASSTAGPVRILATAASTSVDYKG